MGNHSNMQEYLTQQNNYVVNPGTKPSDLKKSMLDQKRPRTNLTKEKPIATFRPLTFDNPAVNFERVRTAAADYDEMLPSLK